MIEVKDVDLSVNLDVSQYEIDLITLSLSIGTYWLKNQTLHADEKDIKYLEYLFDRTKEVYQMWAEVYSDIENHSGINPDWIEKRLKETFTEITDKNLLWSNLMARHK